MGLILILLVVEAFTTVSQRIFCEGILVRRRDKGMADVLVWGGYFCVHSLVSCGGRYLAGMAWADPLICAIPFFLTVRFLYADSARTLAIVTVFLYLSGMCAQLLVYYGRGWIPWGLGEDAGLSCIILSRILWFGIVKAVSLLVRRRKGIELYATDWLEVFVTPAGSIGILLVVFVMGRQETCFLCLVVAVMVLMINVFTYYLYEKVREILEKRLREEILARQCEYYVLKDRENIGQWEELRAFRHDIKQHYLVEKMYLEAGDYDTWKKYCEKKLDLLDGKGIIANTGNVYVDTIVNYKADAASGAGVELRADLWMPQDAKMNAEDLGMCLGNLLDNAIEAAKGLEQDKAVELAIRADHNNLFICVRNRYHGEIKREKGRYASSKEDARNHGLGITIIRQVVEKYHGEMDIEDSDGEFNVKVLLYEFLD